MKLNWQVEPTDVKRVQAFLDQYKDDPWVKHRAERNLREHKPHVEKADFWKQMVVCLLTSQQRSGPESAVTRFSRENPFPLNYSKCLEQEHLEAFAKAVLTDFRGIRMTSRIPTFLAHNLRLLEGGLWKETLDALDSLRLAQEPAKVKERATAEFIDTSLAGFGPKQSRNLLQSLGLTRYEIPIDSRITDWLNNEFDFPVPLSATGLGDRGYYNFVMDGVQELCKACGVLPCILDASVFASFDPGRWTEQNVKETY